MLKIRSTEYSVFQQKCDLLLKEDEIRFAGLINSMLVSAETSVDIERLTQKIMKIIGNI